MLYLTVNPIAPDDLMHIDPESKITHWSLVEGIPGYVCSECGDRTSHVGYIRDDGRRCAHRHCVRVIETVEI